MTNSAAPSLLDEAFLRKLEALSLLVRQARPGQWQGERRSPKRGQSVEFADYRSYAPGDDFRLVDWNAYARLERFFLKLFVEEEDLTVHLLIDTSQSMDWPPADSADHPHHKLAYAQKTAAALGYITLAGLDKVTAAGFGAGLTQQFPPHRGRNQAFALFNFLTQLTTAANTNLNQTLLAYAAQSRQPGPLLIISDLMDSTASTDQAAPPWENGLLALLSRRFEITVLHLLSPDEADPPIMGDLRLLDSETGQAVEITANQQALSRYKAGLIAWQDDLYQWLAKRDVRYLPITTDLPFETLIFSFLRQQKLLK